MSFFVCCFSPETVFNISILRGFFCFRSMNQISEGDTDYADDIALLANASAQAKTLLHNLEKATA